MGKHKRLGYALSAVALTLGSGILAPAVFADGDNPFCIENADGEDNCYSTLQAAFDNVPSDGTLTTVYLNSSEDIVYDGGGAFYEKGKGPHPANANYNVVFDLKGKTYVISKSPVGSTGYETQAFHAEKGGKFVLKDGTVKAAVGSGVWFIFQNYADTTFENVTLDARDNPGITYVASNNFGSLTVKGNSQILAANNRVAFDLWYGMSAVYDDGVTVTFGSDFTGKVEGKIEYGRASRVAEDSGWRDKTKLIIENGDFDVDFVASSGNALDGANISILGGRFTAEPDASDIAEGDKAYKTEDGYVVVDPDELEKQNLEYADDDNDGVYELLPIKIDMVENGAMSSDSSKAGALGGQAVFEGEFIADRNAYFELSTLDDDEVEALTLDTTLGGELVLSFDATLWNRYNEPVEDVDNTLITIRVSLTKEQYDILDGYGKIEVVYFDEDSNEKERLPAELKREGEDYWLEFKTTHLSTYGVVGVNEEEAAAPETGTVTAAGASAMSAALVTAAAVGVLTAIASFSYLVRRKS